MVVNFRWKGIGGKRSHNVNKPGTVVAIVDMHNLDQFSANNFAT